MQLQIASKRMRYTLLKNDNIDNLNGFQVKLGRLGNGLVLPLLVCFWKISIELIFSWGAFWKKTD